MKKKSGFTLIEVIVVLALTVLLMGAVYSMLKPIMATISLNRDLESYKQTANVIQTMITEKMKYANRILISSTDRGEYAISEVGEFDQFIVMKDVGINGEGYLATADINDRKPVNVELMLPKEFYKGLKTKVTYNWNKSVPKMIQVTVELYNEKSKMVYSAQTAVDCLNVEDIYYAFRFPEIYVVILQ